MCKQTNCRFYKFVYGISDNVVNVTVYFKGPSDTDHKEEYSYWLKGSERKRVKDELKTTLPNVFRHKEICKVEPEVIKEGNWQNLRSLAVYQKIRSETFSESDKHKDPFLDILIKSNEQEQKYIQFPNLRTLVHLYSKQQVKTLVKKGQKVTAYFDATGSVVRPTINDRGYRILYYSLVVNIKGVIVPIAELTSFLHYFKHFVLTVCNKTWPIFNVVVTDWSFALMTSVCQGINNVTLYSYLKITYKYVTNENDNSKVFSMVVLKICCAHYIKMICNRLSKSNRQKRGIKNVIIDSIAVLIQSTSLEDLSFNFQNLLTILQKKCFENE